MADPEADLIPGTLEGSLVKICDTATYVARDIEDAISLGLIQRENIPENPTGKAKQRHPSQFRSRLSRGQSRKGLPSDP